MSTTYGLRKLIFSYQGLFDFEGLYRTIVNFYKERHYDYNEDVYKDKEGSPLGHEVELKASPDKKVSEYIKYYHKFNWVNWDVHEVEVVRGGKTVTLTWARLRFEIIGQIKLDWQDLGKTNPKLRKFFEGHVFKREITELHEPTLMFETQEAVDTIKRFLHAEVTRTEKEVHP